MKTKLIATAASLALALPAFALDGPEEPVRAIYGAQGVPDTAAEADRWLARDLAAADKRDLAAGEPRPSTDFDWRYGSQEYEISDLVFMRGEHVTPPGELPTRVEAAVSFRSFNHGPYTVTWILCLGESGWRVADVHSNDTGGGWRLREMLELPSDQVQC